MAKKKTTSTKKTKTSAKKAAAAVKTVTKKAVSPIIGRTRTLHKVNIALQVLLAGLVLFVMKPVFYALSLSYVTRDALLSDAETVFVPAEKVAIDFDVRWLLVAMIACSALYSVLAVSRWRANYERAQAGRVYLWRWVFLAIGFALMVKFVSLVAGVEDIATIKMGGGLMAFAMALAWLSERGNETTAQSGQAQFWLALVSGLVSMYAILLSLLGTSLFGFVRLPWYAYVLDLVVATGFIAVLINLWRSNKRAGRLGTYAAVERNYVVISILTQLVFIAVALVGLA